MAHGSLVEGAWDVHVHAAPSLFPRWGDGLDLVRASQKAQMAGLVLKYHHGSSVEAAHHLNAQWKSGTVYGGVALNAFVGGLNPFAVDSALALGGKVVWLPTIHAEAHGKACGCLGGFEFQKSKARLNLETGLSLLNDSGSLKEEVKSIVDMVSSAGGVLASGHVSLKEIRALKDFISQSSKNTRLLINHVFFYTPALSTKDIEALADPHTWFESVALTSRLKGTTAHSVAMAMAVTPKAQWIVASDSGQLDNPPSPDMLGQWMGDLVEAGLPREKAFSMVQDQPQRLLEGT